MLAQMSQLQLASAAGYSPLPQRNLLTEVHNISSLQPNMPVVGLYLMGYPKKSIISSIGASKLTFKLTWGKVDEARSS